MSYPIPIIRHSTAHLLAAAVMELWPQTKLGVGPVVEHGFYYDLDLPTRLTEQHFQKIEKQMRAIIVRQEKFVREEMPIDAAVLFFEEKKQPYKVELLRDLKTKGTTAVRPEEAQEFSSEKPTHTSVYWTGKKFVDLCRGPHVENTSALGAFKLMRVAGAYWRGNEKNPQLQRIYGIAFATQKELDDHVTMLAEAERRDHKILGPALDLFTFSELVGPGLPLWTPNGTLVRNILDEFVWMLRKKRGYMRVEIPHITKKDLYEKSGHWDKFKNELFRITTREGHEFAMKPMNCPHHTQIYARRAWSYRDLPQRYANTTTCYRDEQTGELAGLSRTRAFSQDDAHVFCRMSHAKEEALKIWDIIHEFYPTFGFSLRVRLSLHDSKHPEKYLGDAKKWATAEALLREIVTEKKIAWIDGVGEAAFYGPKLDFMAKDAIGREWQVATIQLDLNMPERFDLTCTNEAGEKERIVMIHAAIMGSIERFLSILIEHTAGAFPTWLAPVQVAVIPVSDDHAKAAEKLSAKLDSEGFRVSVDGSRDTVGYKIRKAEKQRVPYMVVIGDKEKSLRKLAVRVRGEKEIKTMALSTFVKRLQKETKK